MVRRKNKSAADFEFKKMSKREKEKVASPHLVLSLSHILVPCHFERSEKSYSCSVCRKNGQAVESVFYPNSGPESYRFPKENKYEEENENRDD